MKLKPIVLLIRASGGVEPSWKLWDYYDDDAAAEREYYTHIRGKGVTAWAWWGSRVDAEMMLAGGEIKEITRIE